MIRRISSALMIAEDDIGEILDEWSKVPGLIKAHVKARCPLHRYEGELSLGDNNLIFHGWDIEEGKEYQLAIGLDTITDIYLGFSEHLKGSIDPVFGVGGPVPFAVRYQDDGKNRAVYFNTGFNSYLAHRGTNSRHWYEAIQEAIIKHRQLKLTDRRSPSLVTA